MAQFKDVDPFDLIPENPYPMQPNIDKLIREYIEWELTNGLESISQKISKAISDFDKSVTIYTISVQNLIKYYKLAYTSSEVLINKSCNISSKDLIYYTEKSEMYIKICSELLNKKYNIYINYDNFMDLRAIELVIILK